MIPGILQVCPGIPSGKHTFLLWKIAIEIVDLPINSMVVFQFVMGQFARG